MYITAFLLLQEHDIMEKYVEKFSKGCKIKLGIPLHF